MQPFNENAAAATSYGIALLALFMEHSNTIMTVLGFILLLARLVQEVPRAVYQIKKFLGRV